MANRQDPIIDFAARLLELITGASTTSTYKYALLMTLVDLCQENVGDSDGPRGSVTTRQIAQKVAELYWPQTRPYHTGTILRQLNNRGVSGLVDRISDFRLQLSIQGQRTVYSARVENPVAYEELLDRIEWTYIQYPIPLLQNVGGRSTSLLYTVSWDSSVRKGEVRRYQRGTENGEAQGAFDNRIQFLPGVEEYLASLSGLLRPLIRREWARFVSLSNSNESDDLEGFLFDPSREDLSPVRGPLIELQEGRCFYCDGNLGRSADVDHFLPWSKCGDDQLMNLVAAHPKCNNKKRDHLAGQIHLHRWRDRGIQNSSELRTIGEELNWPVSNGRSWRLSRAIYLRLPPHSLLWIHGDQFEEFDWNCISTILKDVA